MTVKRAAAFVMAVIMLCTAGCAVMPATPRLSAPPEMPSAEPTATPSSEPDPTPTVTMAIEPESKPYLIDGLCTVVCSTNINLRREPDASSELIATIRDGTNVKVLAFDGIYAYVEIIRTREKGYVVAGYLKPIQNIIKLNNVKLTSTYSYEDMYLDMMKLEEEYPDKVKVTSIGRSVNGRELYVMLIGKERAEYNVFVQAGIHGREHMTSLLLMALAEDWLNLGANESVCFHIMPMANPDGVMISERAKLTGTFETIYSLDVLNGNTRLTGDRYLRQWKANANGVDLNRNFDAMWDKIVSGSAPSYENFKGDYCESEPETQALVAYTRRNDFDLTLSYHATGSMIYWQFGGDSPVNEASRQLAEMLAKMSAYTLKEDDGTSFGGYKDWANMRMRIPSLTIEIGTRTAPLPVTDFYNIWLRNRYTFKTVLTWLKTSSEK